VFDYIYEKAEIGRPDGGIIWQVALAGSTPFTLPEGVEDERHGQPGLARPICSAISWLNLATARLMALTNSG